MLINVLTEKRKTCSSAKPCELGRQAGTDLRHPGGHEGQVLAVVGRPWEVAQGSSRSPVEVVSRGDQDGMDG